MSRPDGATLSPPHVMPASGPIIHSPRILVAKITWMAGTRPAGTMLRRESEAYFAWDRYSFARILPSSTAGWSKGSTPSA